MYVLLINIKTTVWAHVRVLTSKPLSGRMYVYYLLTSKPLSGRMYVY